MTTNFLASRVIISFSLRYFSGFKVCSLTQQYHMAKRKINTYTIEGRIIGDNDMRQEVKQYINAGK